MREGYGANLSRGVVGVSGRHLAEERLDDPQEKRVTDVVGGPLGKLVVLILV
jgi:hypothetical protein